MASSLSRELLLDAADLETVDPPMAALLRHYAQKAANLERLEWEVLSAFCKGFAAGRAVKAPGCPVDAFSLPDDPTQQPDRKDAT